MEVTSCENKNETKRILWFKGLRQLTSSGALMKTVLPTAEVRMARALWKGEKKSQ